MNRRLFLQRLGLVTAAAAAAAVGQIGLLDPERLLWTPGRKTFFIPDTPRLANVAEMKAAIAAARSPEIGNFDAKWIALELNAALARELSALNPHDARLRSPRQFRHFGNNEHGAPADLISDYIVEKLPALVGGYVGGYIEALHTRILRREHYRGDLTPSESVPPMNRDAYRKAHIDPMAKSLADKIHENKIEAFGTMRVPHNVEASTVHNTTNNVELRVIKDYDVISDRYIVRVDFFGYTEG